MTLNNYKRRKRWLGCHATFLVVILVLLLTTSSLATAAEDEDYDEEEISLAPNLNCFSLVDENSWSRILRLDPSNGVLSVQLNNTGPRVITCLQDQVRSKSNIHYSLVLSRKHHREVNFEQRTVKLSDWLTKSIKEVGNDDVIVDKNNINSDVQFSFVLLKGVYKVHFKSCDLTKSNNTALLPDVEATLPDEAFECDVANEIVSDALRVEKTSNLVDDESWCFGSKDFVENSIRKDPPTVDQMTVHFRFEYISCFREILTNEGAVVTLFALPEEHFIHNKTSNAGCFGEKEGVTRYLRTRVPISRELDNAMTVFTYQTPSLPGDYYYCLVVETDHLLCRDIDYFNKSNNNATTAGVYTDDDHPFRHASQRNVLNSVDHRRPKFCRFESEPVLVTSRPWLGLFLPICTSHFACAWIYIAAIGLAVLTVSCLLAILCIYCCCKDKPRHFKTHHHIPTEDQHTFDTLCLADIKPKKTWVEVHEDFYREPPKNPGKILLLYSPDSKPFKDLQQAFRSFLELACHCVVLDLFDEELFQSIAYDPEAWLFNLLQDDKFKIVIICSENAFKRQQALLKAEVLNIPDVNSSLDGLFSAGLKFIQEQHAYDYHRLALVRYEMLALTSPEFTLQDMVPNREFLVPTQLHDLFCWIHDHDPLDLLGKPWDRFHLELQLLQDSLKQARLDRRYV